MRNFIALEEKVSVREFIANDLNNAGLRIDTNKYRNIIINQPSPHITNNPKQQQQQQGPRVFNVPLHQMDTISVKVENVDLTVPIFLRWCFDCIRRSIKHEGLFRKSGGSQRVKELMARIEDGPLTPSLSPSNTVFDVCSLFKEFLRRLTYPLITYPLQDLLLDCFSMRSLSSDKKVEIYLNILLLLPDKHLHALIYILRFLHEITLNERDNKMNAKNLAICVGPGIMRTAVEGKASVMTEQCATSVSDIVEVLIINAAKLGYVADSVYERSQMLLEMRQKEAVVNADESFAIENGIDNGISNGKINDPANAKKRRSGSVKEFLVHMTNRLRRRSGSNNDSRDQTNAFLDQSGKLSSSHTREHRYHYQQNSISGHCLSSSSSSTTTTKRKSSDDPNGGNSKRGKTKTTQEKSSLPDMNRFTSPISAFRRKKKTPGSSNDPGFPFKIEHSHLPQLLHFTDEVPLRFTNAVINTAPAASSSSSSSSTTAPNGALQPSEMQPSLLTNAAPAACINKSLDAKKLNLLDSWKWPKSSRKAERKPLVAIHAPMLVTSTVGSSSLSQSPPSPIKPNNGSNQSSSQQMAGSSMMHSSFGVPRRHSDDVVSTSLSTTAYRPRRSISSSGGQQQTRHVVCMLNNYSHSLPSSQQQNASDDDEPDEQTQNIESMPSNLNLTQESYDDEDDIANELNLAVVVGHEDIQSLRAFSTEQTHPENGSLDVAFIDETDVERQKNQVENEQRDQSSAMDIPNNDNETLSQTIVAPGEQQSIEMQDVCQTNDLDEILRRNENRCIRLTDSDDEEHVNFSLSMNRTTPPTIKKDELKSTTPKMPVRLSSSISNLISTSSLTSTSTCKERSLSCSLSQTTNELFHSKTLGENDENIGVLNGGRESILQLKGELAGRVLRQVRAFEQRSSENIQNRSIVPTSTSTLSLQQKLDDSKTELTSKPSSTILSTLSSLTIMNTPEQNLIEQALRNSNKIISSSNGTGEVTRSVKRLQNTPIRRWRERAREFERRHQITPPYRLLNRKRK
ncbi:unnamed protein product [Rotaria magnacalcarata]|uniref:Rho-GAP domain-containing protein n=16 Tax=Rotaria magnacalcarata TaxID=392030 RepID=A0A819FX38_9BILA|nr:unnamed protein product [Rotaria magnacalcarata]CAF2161556.1 unnamed protein product [Rotaria magnacalcarata]CAF3840165.1 unnamed protein product [Rotaria magnacalcarata]CAF3876491.1 unnamed protein product [Rotaria magnacalcarata]